MVLCIQNLYKMACLYSSEDVVIVLIDRWPTLLLEFRSPLAVCLHMNTLSNALQKVMHKYALFSVSALLFILCFVFVDTIFLYSDDVFSLLVDFSPYFFVHPRLRMILHVNFWFNVYTVS